MSKQKATIPYQLISFFLFCFILYLSCKKTEQPVPVPAAATIVEKEFFKSPENIDASVKGIIRALNYENEKTPFAETMVKNAGHPQWEYAIKKSKAFNRGDTTEQDINIPLVKDGEMKTSAILAVTINNADTAYQLFYPQYYTRYAMGDDTIAGDRLKGIDFFSVFAGFDYAMFGITQYRVNDGRIFGYNQHDTAEVTVSYPSDSTGRHRPGSLPNPAAADYMTICKTVTSCVYASTRHMNARDGGKCSSSVNCVYVWVDGGTTSAPSGGGSATGGGTSGTASTGGGSGTSGLTTTPCARRMNSNGREMVTSDPCGDPWIGIPAGFTSEGRLSCASFNFVPINSTTNWQEAGVRGLQLVGDWFGVFAGFSIKPYGDIYVGIPLKKEDKTVITPGMAATAAATAANHAAGVQQAKYLAMSKLEFDAIPATTIAQEFRTLMTGFLSDEIGAACTVSRTPVGATTPKAAVWNSLGGGNTCR